MKKTIFGLVCFLLLVAQLPSQKLPQPQPNLQYFDNTGAVCNGCKLYTYTAGGTTPVTTYTSASGGSSNTNPVVFNSAGRASVWLTPGVSYRLDLYTSANVLLWSVDNVPGGSLAGLSSVTANYVYAGPTTGAAAAPQFRALVAADIPSLTSSYASTTLNNLGTTNINASLLPQTTLDLGSTAKQWRDLYLHGAGTYATTYLKVTGTPTSTRTVTIQDATQTLVGRDTTDTLTNKTLTTPTIGDFANATHTHQNAAGGGTLAQAAIQPILPIFAQTQTVTVGNTVTETTLIGTGQGSVTLPANFFVAGKTIHIHASGYYSSTAGPNVTMRVRLGCNVILTTGAKTSGNGTNEEWEVNANITCRTTGVTGTIFSQGYYQEHHTGGLVAGMANTATNTVDTTGTLAVSVTVEWGTMAAGNTMSATNITLENAI